MKCSRNEMNCVMEMITEDYENRKPLQNCATAYGRITTIKKQKTPAEIEASSPESEDEQEADILCAVYC